ncbi:MAG TPA: multicopper oxidase domain-containing protein [Rhizomicrobium sp.]|jgi:FtsP/CotA-like multicopper oxidase with cupredoxin domain|nr:multicopper oxidase domain-containing protein [Rhizomicrobium sp.]
MARIIIALAMLLVTGILQPTFAGTKTTTPCARPAVGSEVLPPPDLFSSNGVLNVSLNYYTAVSDNGITLFCFQTADGTESPTLNANPGDTINITLTNMVPKAPGAPAEIVSNDSNKCGAGTMTTSSTNIHFHGMNVSPRCHSDEVIHTLVNSGQTFQYKIKIPANEPPGLYWYHPHIHGMSSVAVQGGASGAIIVEGIENIQPVVAGLPQRLLVVRDQPLPGLVRQGTGAPFWDLSVNYVPVTYPKFVPSVIKMQAGSKEFWRVANASANSILDLQVMYDSKPQQLQVVGFDGVPTDSQDGKRQGSVVTEKHLLIPPAGRAEFMVTAPDATVKTAELITNRIDSGPAGDYLPARRLALIQTSTAARHLPKVPQARAEPHRQRFEDLSDAKVTDTRKLFFYEVFIQSRQPPPKKAHAIPPPDKDGQMQFYITVDGQQNQIYDPNNPPAITTNKGAVEDWTIENRTTEDHEFHIHQIHFLLLAIDGKPVPKNQRQFYDTFPVKYWDGESPTYPSITVRMDFRGAVTGDFVYHCHILDHEDGGMMAIIRVNPPAKSKQGQVAHGGGSKQVHAAR